MASDIADRVKSCAHDGVPIEIAGAGTVLSGLPEPPAHHRLDLRDHRGIVAYDPAELTVTLRAGTTVSELDAELAAHRQECPIEGVGSTVGGRVACGLSGPRRLGVGHVRDWVLGARVITADGCAVRIGAPTVKNVTGYDLPRLCCGSWGTLVVLVEVTLRVRPRPAARDWYFAETPAPDVLRRLYGAASIVRTRAGVHVLLEGHPSDCRTQADRAGLQPGAPPMLPHGARLAVPPSRIEETITRIDGDFAAEVGVGIIHADPPAAALPALRDHCEVLDGRMLVLKRGAGLSCFGNQSVAVHDARLKRALDPAGIFAPWRFAA
jgi:glycolate oxidase FAD binding subunit